MKYLDEWAYDKMDVFYRTEEFECYEKARGLRPKTTGFVPTMGNLHLGHLSLIEKSLLENDETVVSIFVNPKQFGPREDFHKYPRTLEEDLEKIKELQQRVVVYAPCTVEEVFPRGFSTNISLGSLSKKLCGQFRPGHFDGVATVVYRLFSLVLPTVAYFGEKDFQQCLIIKKMISDLRLPVSLVTLPIVRDEDGLPLSSRNQYLSFQGRKQALLLPRALNNLKELFEKYPYSQAISLGGEYIKEELKTHPWEYLDLYDAETLDPLVLSSPEWPLQRLLLIAGAISIGGTRLIDNQLVSMEGQRDRSMHY